MSSSLGVTLELFDDTSVPDFEDSCENESVLVGVLLKVCSSERLSESAV